MSNSYYLLDAGTNRPICFCDAGYEYGCEFHHTVVVFAYADLVAKMQKNLKHEYACYGIQRRLDIRKVQDNKIPFPHYSMTFLSPVSS